MTTLKSVKSFAAFLIFSASALAQGPTLKIIYDFQGLPGDGQQPGSVVADSNGILYGNAGGGSSNNGIVFQLTPPASAGGAWTEKIVYEFSGGADGSGPGALAIGRAGVLYGVTSGGGTAKHGVAFSLTPPTESGGAWTKTVIYNFEYASSGFAIGANGVLYATMEDGGDQNCFTDGSGYRGCGSVYSLTPPSSASGAWTQTVLYTFTNENNDAGNPQAGVVIGPGGLLYGTSARGGTSGGGTVFSLTPPSSAGGAWTETVLVSFKWGGRGYEPQSSLTAANGGTLYGTTWQGGNGGCPNEYSLFSCGSVFAITPPAAAGGAWAGHYLYDFYQVSGTPDAYSPVSAPVFGNAAGQPVLYGTSVYGGSMNIGVLYSLTPPAIAGGGWTETLVHSFVGGPSDGAFPSGLVRGPDGAIYGVTSEGGPGNNFGTAFSLRP